MEVYVDGRPLEIPEDRESAADALNWIRDKILKDRRVIMDISVDGIPMHGPDGELHAGVTVGRIDITTANLDDTVQELMDGFADALPTMQERAMVIANRLRDGVDLHEAWEACAQLFDDLPWAIDGLANLNNAVGGHFSTDVQEFAESWMEAYEAEDSDRLAELLEEELAHWLEDNSNRIERLRGALREA